MNRKQKMVLTIAAGIIALMLLFPPYESYKWGTTEYSFIAAPPEYKELAFGNLITQWIGVFLISGILILRFKDEED